MKFYPLAIIFLLIGLAVMSFNPVYKGIETENTIVNKGLTDFKAKLDQLKSDVYQFSEDKISLKQLQESLKNTRNSFKEIEFYIAYHYPEFTKNHLNAAPLFHIEAAGTTAYTLPPEGLQVLDELIFSDEAAEEKGKNQSDHRFFIQQLCKFLFKFY
ncbi:hypothetical protein [Chryseobacterium wanjuense]